MRFRYLPEHGPQRKAWSTFYSGRDAGAETPHPRVEQECHRYASRNETSPSLSTLYPSAMTDAPAASGDLTTLTYWRMCPSTIPLLLSRLFARVRKRRFLSLLKQISLILDSLAFTLVFVLSCLVLPF